jgi:hypothetical protein
MRKVHGGRHSIDSEKRRLSHKMVGKLIWEILNTAYFQMCSMQHLNKPIEPRIPIISAQILFCGFWLVLNQPFL